jgi:hypothetical protein
MKKIKKNIDRDKFIIYNKNYWRYIMRKMLMFLIVFTNSTILGFSQSNNYANGNGTILEIKVVENIKWVFRRHIQSIKIGDLSREENLNIYNKQMLENENIIGKLKLDDDIY